MLFIAVSEKIRLISLLGVILFFFGATASVAVTADSLQSQSSGTIPILLSPEEQLWLKEHPVIRVAADPGWRPLEYRDKDGEFKGIAIDYLKIVENQLGIKFEIARDATWAELIAKSKAREIDMFSCIAVTPERETYLTFTKPYLSFPAAIFTRNDAPYVGNLQELANVKVAVVNGYAFHEYMSQDYPDIDLVPVDSVQQGLKLLETGKVSAFVGNLLVGSYHISSEGMVFLKVAGETPYHNELGFAVRKDWGEFAGILQKALDSISAEEKREIYTNWVALTYEHNFDRTLLYQVVAGFIALFALTLIVIQQRQLKARKKSAKEIERSKAVFEAVFQSITDALVLADPQRRIVMVNAAFIKMFGYRSEEVMGLTTELIYADSNAYAEQGKERFSPQAVIGQSVYEMDYRRKDGSVFHGETLGVKVNDPQGALIGFLGCIRDISDRKQIEEQLLKNDRLKNEFIATASHELRTPLTVILGYIDLLVEGEFLSPEHKNEALDSIYEKGLVLDRLVNDLLDVSRIESGQAQQLVRTPARISEIVEQVCTQYERMSHNRILTTTFAEKEPLLDIDRDRMVQVFENLLGNAIKFSPEDGVITVSGDIVDLHYRVTVSDRGCGMDAEHLHNIFNKFYRIDGSNTAVKGLGIGLYLVKSIIDGHGGKVWVESRRGEGSMFFIDLPLQTSE